MEGANQSKVKATADAPRKPNRSLAGGGSGDNLEPVNPTGNLLVTCQCCRRVSVQDV